MDGDPRSSSSVTVSTRPRNSWAPMRKDSIMTGMLRMSVMMPAVATAPAPMYRT